MVFLLKQVLNTWVSPPQWFQTEMPFRAEKKKNDAVFVGTNPWMLSQDVVWKGDFSFQGACSRWWDLGCFENWKSCCFFFFDLVSLTRWKKETPPTKKKNDAKLRHFLCSWGSNLRIWKTKKKKWIASQHLEIMLWKNIHPDVIFFSRLGEVPLLWISNLVANRGGKNITPKAAMFLIKSHSLVKVFGIPSFSWLYEKKIALMIYCHVLPKNAPGSHPKKTRKVVRIFHTGQLFFFLPRKSELLKHQQTSTFLGGMIVFFPTEKSSGKKNAGKKSPLQIKWDLMFLHVLKKKNRRWDI